MLCKWKKIDVKKKQKTKEGEEQSEASYRVMSTNTCGHL
jgi:hypothetical protein